MTIEYIVIAILSVLLLHAWCKWYFYKRVARGFKVIVGANFPGIREK